MKVSVVGAGPAGTYFAIALKRQMPSADITIFEKEHERTSSGLGYTLPETLPQEIYAIDQKANRNLGSKLSEPWDHIHIEAKGQLLAIPFSLAGIRRASLLNYLRELAQDRGIEIHYGKRLSSRDIDSLVFSSDLLVGADGINSVVRERYAVQVGAYSVPGTNSFTWLTGNSDNDNLRTVLAKHKGVLYIGTSYPLDSETKSIIIERSTSHERIGTPATSESAATLEKAISTMYTTVHLPDQEFKWNPIRLNGVGQPTFSKVALIGESAISTHYCLGVGLSLSFVAANHLAAFISSTQSLEQAFDQYHHTVVGFLKRMQNDSIKGMRWLESADLYYDLLSARDLIDSFRFKAKS